MDQPSLITRATGIFCYLWLLPCWVAVRGLWGRCTQPPGASAGQIWTDPVHLTSDLFSALQLTLRDGFTLNFDTVLTSVCRLLAHGHIGAFQVFCVRAKSGSILQKAAVGHQRHSSPAGRWDSATVTHTAKEKLLLRRTHFSKLVVAV